MFSEIRKIAEQKSIGFPWLASAYAEYYKLRALKDADYLESKRPAASKTAKEIKHELAGKLRQAQYESRHYRYIVEYYESLFPDLEAYLEKDADTISHGLPSDQTHYNHLSPEVYANLSDDTAKNQLDLDRWWKGRGSAWTAGVKYERYIGYLWENNGAWKVEYTGALKGLEDMGRDLIVHGRDKIIIIQCKNWKPGKEIHEKHVMQLYGSVVSYQLEHPGCLKVEGMICTTINLSPTAQKTAEFLGITVQKEKFPADGYPMIKCNISYATGEKIYHLPFDQQYDTIVIDKRRGECYARTCQEAEDKGFRRAWRWAGPNDNQ